MGPFCHQAEPKRSRYDTPARRISIASSLYDGTIGTKSYLCTAAASVRVTVGAGLANFCSLGKVGERGVNVDGKQS